MESLLLYVGIVTAAVAAAAGILSGIVFHFKRKLLEVKLDEEYGKAE